MSRDANRRSEYRYSRPTREDEAALTRGIKSKTKTSTDAHSGKSSANTPEHSDGQVFAKSPAKTTEVTKSKVGSTNKEKQPKGGLEANRSHVIEETPSRDMPRSPRRVSDVVSPRSSKTRRGSAPQQTETELKPPESGHVARTPSPHLEEPTDGFQWVEINQKKTKKRGKIVKDEHVDPTSCINFAFEYDEGSSPNFSRKHQTQATSSKTKTENPPAKNSTGALQIGEFTKHSDADLKIAPTAEVKGKPAMQTLKENEEIAKFRDYNYGACSSNGNFKQNFPDSEPQPKYAPVSSDYTVKQNILRENIPNKQNQYLQGSENEKDQSIGNNSKTFQETRESGESLPAPKPARRLPCIKVNEDSSFAESISRRPTDFGDIQSTRPQTRSFSLTPENNPLSQFQKSLKSPPEGRSKPETRSQPVGRSQSMRLASTSDLPDKPKKLLHELSFADTEYTDGKNYGALRRKNSIRKRSVVLETVDDSDDDSVKDPGSRVPAKFKADLLLVMQELLNRGKVKQVAVVEQTSNAMLVSLPTWDLSRQDLVGLVKAVTCPQQLMLKLAIGREVYTCFAHGSNKLVGRNGEKILVTQKTNTCVVVGVAVDDTPGSCMYEVSELSRALIDKEW